MKGRRAAFLLLPAVGVGLSTAQEQPRARVEVRKGPVVNLVTDPVAGLALARSNGGERPAFLPAAVAAWYPHAGAGICWDTTSCRIVCAWRGDRFLERAPGDAAARPAGNRVTILAEGPVHVSPTLGAYSDPRYFGFRLHPEDGAPEFLYTSGRLAVSERFSFSADGGSLLQHFTIENPPADVTLVFPESFQNRISVDKGTRKGRFLTVSKAEAGAFTVTYRLAEEDENKPD